MARREAASTQAVTTFSRSVNFPDHRLQTPETFVRAPLPGMRNATAIVHASPAGGAGFVQYTVEFEANGALARLGRPAVRLRARRRSHCRRDPIGRKRLLLFGGRQCHADLDRRAVPRRGHRETISASWAAPSRKLHRPRAARHPFTSRGRSLAGSARARFPTTARSTSV